MAPVLFFFTKGDVWWWVPGCECEHLVVVAALCIPASNGYFHSDVGHFLLCP